MSIIPLITLRSLVLILLTNAYQLQSRQMRNNLPFILMGLKWFLAIKDWPEFGNIKYFFYKADILIILENSGNNYLIPFLILNHRFQQPPVEPVAAGSTVWLHCECKSIILIFYLLWNASFFLTRDAQRLGVFYLPYFDWSFLHCF